MRSDGCVSYYAVQHLVRADWVDTALDVVLYSDRHRSEVAAGTALGDELREIMDGQSASTDLWQRYGIHGFVDKELALRALAACRRSGTGRSYRLVKRSIMQLTEEVRS